MAWREAFLIRFGPGAFSGVTMGRWLAILRENRFAVDPPYWGRAYTTTWSSLVNSLQAWREERTYGAKVRAVKVSPPLFILGIWRSGTTHLHNLLSRDDRFAFANSYQVCYPSTFLTTEERNARLVNFFMPKTRPQDNVVMGMQEPQEEEFAFCALTGRAIPMGWAFPRREEYYRRFLTLRDTTQAEAQEWKDALATFVKKLSFKYEKPLILKSPGHTARIKTLLEVFPDARFVHIHRNPHDVFRSTVHLMKKIAPWFAFQRTDYRGLEDDVIRQYREVYDAYFEERHLIPDGHLHEIRFSDLEADPVGQLRGLYSGLDLPAFAHMEPPLRRYVDSVASYKKNEFQELPADLRERLSREWRRSFEEWGYAA